MLKDVLFGISNRKNGDLWRKIIILKSYVRTVLNVQTSNANTHTTSLSKSTILIIIKRYSSNPKKFCEDFVKSGKCQYGEYCALAHSDLELKIKPLHLLPVNNNFLLFEFKSVFCPFSKLEHDRYTCVYAHNWQDFKRPFSEKLKPIMCKAWDKEKEILVYTEGM